jgi:hypothetical protein
MYTQVMKAIICKADTGKDVEGQDYRGHGSNCVHVALSALAGRDA